MVSKVHILSNILGKPNSISYMKLSTSLSSSSYQKNFKTNITATNPLIDGPDFTYLNGKPTPLRRKQRDRAIAQKELITKAMESMKEIQFALQRHQSMTDEEKRRTRETIETKFKEKNILLNEK